MQTIPAGGRLSEFIIKYGKRWRDREEHYLIKKGAKERVERLSKMEPHYLFTVVPFKIKNNNGGKLYDGYAIYQRLVK